MRKYSALWILAAIVCAAAVWLYAQRVVIPHQVADAAAHGWPRGNLSDIYPRWLGTRELLLRGRSPYSPEITLESQTGFYGRPLDPNQGPTYRYQQGFYYPVYVIFLFAPTIHLPFEIVRRGFLLGFAALTVISVPLWLRVVRWRVPMSAQAAIAIFTLGSLPVMQGLKIQQMTLLVAPLLAVAMALLAADRQFAAGIILALATIKPQLVWLLLFWLLIWTAGDWRRRLRWAGSFLLTMGILWAASEWYLPHWLFRFWSAVREYHDSTGEMSASAMLMGATWSRALELLAFVLMTIACWQQRRRAADSAEFAFTLCLVLAATVLLVPSYGPYNQTLLLPAFLIMIQRRRAIWKRSYADRVLLFLTLGLVAWPWLSGLALAALSFVLRPEAVGRGWAVPFWTALLIPVEVAAVMLVYAYQRIFTDSREAPSS